MTAAKNFPLYSDWQFFRGEKAQAIPHSGEVVDLEISKSASLRKKNKKNAEDDLRIRLYEEQSSAKVIGIMFIMIPASLLMWVGIFLLFGLLIQ